MSTRTTISWTDATWNPIRGCSRVSPGCDNCYAMRQAHRFAGHAQPYDGLTVLRPKDSKRPGVDWSGRVRFIADALEEPLTWRAPQRIFVNSMSDLFHPQVTAEQVAEVFGVMAVAAKKFGGDYKPGVGWRNERGPHTFQVLTKRPARARELLPSGRFRQLVARAAYRWAMDRVDAGWLQQCISGVREWGNNCTLDKMWPLPNVWLGVSVEDRAAKYRIDELRDLPAAVRFLSCEPLLEDLGELDLRGIDWVIVGGESGNGARPCALEWIERIIEQCRAAGVAVFVKQLGAFVVSEQRAYLRPDLTLGTDEEAKAELGVGSRWLWRAGLTDRKGADVEQFPEYLGVREFPEVRQ